MLRVVTDNVYGPANPDAERRFRVSGAALRARDADVVALQEVPTDDAWLEGDLGTAGTSPRSARRRRRAWAACSRPGRRTRW